MAESTMLEEYLDLLCLIIEHDPLSIVREFGLDADELDFAIHDKNKAAAVIKTLLSEEGEKKEKREKAVPSKKKKTSPTQPSGNERRGSPKPATPPEGSRAKDQKTLFDGF